MAEKDDEGRNSSGFIFVNDYEHLCGIFETLEEKSTTLLDYFLNSSSNGNDTEFRQYVECFQTILNVSPPLQISVNTVIERCPMFDLSPECKGNGYRSIVCIVEACLKKLVRLCDGVQKSTTKFFSKSGLGDVYPKFKAYVLVLPRLLNIVQFAVILLDISDDHCLYPRETPEIAKIANAIIEDFEGLNRECFYGRTFGFQYVKSIRRIIRVVIIAMAAYGDSYHNDHQGIYRAITSVLHSRKYLFNPELRAKRVTELTQNIDVQFCKAFWGITEEYGTQHGPKFICPTLAVNLEFKLPPCGIGIESLDGNTVDVLFPLHGNGAGLPVRLLCFQKMDGQTMNAIRRAEPPRRVGSDAATSCSPLRSKSKILSKYLMIHCHGGGFVAQTSKSHEIYLRYWAKELKMPILSIDYSLSPEAVFPQALNEAFFTYAWALNNFEKLGTTGEKIVFCGDSAGANLMTSVTLKSIMCNIRLPDSVVVAYPPYRFDNSPTPSRILCLMDALLPMGILKACVQSYAGDPTLFTNTNTSASASCRQRNNEVDMSNSFQFELHSENRHKTKYGSSDNVLIDSEVPRGSYARSFSDSILADADVRFCTDTADVANKGPVDGVQKATSTDLPPLGMPKRYEKVSDSDSSPVDGTWEFVSKDSCDEGDDENKQNENVGKSGAIDLHDPLMSPIFAPDEILLKMPPMSILACSLDPVFDDSVEFIRKLRSLGKDADLHVVDHLPHGFLNFQPFSNEARAACDLMLGCVRTSLNMDDCGC